MARIGKHKDCGGEFVASAIAMDMIIGKKCKKCGQEFDADIVPKKQRDLIEEYKAELGGAMR
jgi:hypothetical protein